MSKTIACTVAALARAATAPLPEYARNLTRAQISERMAIDIPMRVSGRTLRFHASEPGIVRSAYHSLSADRGAEPETIAWIDQMDSGVLWDIGANIGVYSLYAAARGLQVVSFEPRAGTFAALLKNIEINGLTERVSAFCVAVGKSTGLGDLWLRTNDAGAAFHTIGPPEFRTSRQAVPIMTIGDIVSVFGAPPPDFIKIDVDGVEADIVAAGGLESVKSVLVEVGSERAAIAKALFLQGFEANAAITGYNAIFDRKL